MIFIIKCHGCHSNTCLCSITFYGFDAKNAVKRVHATTSNTVLVCCAESLLLHSGQHFPSAVVMMQISRNNQNVLHTSDKLQSVLLLWKKCLTPCQTSHPTLSERVYFISINLGFKPHLPLVGQICAHCQTELTAGCHRRYTSITVPLKPQCSPGFTKHNRL